MIFQSNHPEEKGTGSVISTMKCLRSYHCCLYLSSSHKYYNEVNVSKHELYNPIFGENQKKIKCYTGKCFYYA